MTDDELIGRLRTYHNPNGGKLYRPLMDEATTRLVELLKERDEARNRVERLTEWLGALCDSVEREEEVNGSLSGALMSDMREARAALTEKHNGLR